MKYLLSSHPDLGGYIDKKTATNPYFDFLDELPYEITELPMMPDKYYEVLKTIIDRYVRNVQSIK
jgi:hypothetical protein